MPFGRDLCLAETGQLICNVNELTGFYIVVGKGISEKTLWSVREYLSGKRAPIIRKSVSRFAIQMVRVFGERHFCTDYG